MQTDINMRQCSESEEGIAESSPIDIYVTTGKSWMPLTIPEKVKKDM